MLSFKAMFLVTMNFNEKIHARKQKPGKYFFKYSIILISLINRAGITSEYR